MAEAKKIMTAEAAQAASTPPQAAPIPELIAELKRPVSFEGREISTIDFSHLAELTAADAATIDEMLMRRRDSRMGTIPLLHPAYMPTLAHLASGEPVELFEMLSIRAMRTVSRVINDYVRPEDEDEPPAGADLEVYLLDGLPPQREAGKTLNLECLEDLVVSDMQAALRYARKQPGGKLFERLGALPVHQGYQFYLVSRAMRIPIATLDQLSYRDAMRLRDVVSYFLGDTD